MPLSEKRSVARRAKRAAAETWRRELRGALLFLLLAGCKADRPRANPVPVVAIAADAGAAAGPKVDPTFVAAARAARDAATKLATTCTLHTEYHDNGRVYWDSCTWKRADVEPLRVANIAVRAAAPDGGAGAVFAEHVRLFTEWIEAVTGTPETMFTRTRGTAAHYQRLAIAWNALEPGDPAIVDVVHFESKRDRVLDGGYDEGGLLAWRRCDEGPCVVSGDRL